MSNSLIRTQTKKLYLFARRIAGAIKRRSRQATTSGIEYSSAKFESFAKSMTPLVLRVRFWGYPKLKVRDRGRFSIPASRRLKVAYASPIGSDRSGVSRFSFTLLKTLCAQVDVTVVHPRQRKVEIADRQIDCITPLSFIDLKTQFDLVIINIGNSTFHLDFLDIYVGVPTITILHESKIAHLMVELGTKDKLALVPHLLAGEGLSTVEPSVNKLKGLHNLMQYNLTGFLTRQSDLTVVLSDYAKYDLVKQYGATAQSRVRVLLPPTEFTSLSSRAVAREELGFSEKCFLICSFGVIQRGKLIMELIQGCTELLKRDDVEVRLLLVGAVADQVYMNETSVWLQERGLEERVTITGWVSDEKFESFQAACDVAIQMRSGNTGETSAAVFNSLGAGVPTIINTHAAMAEIPDEAVFKLQTDDLVSELAQLLDTLIGNPRLLLIKAYEGKRFIREKCSPKAFVNQLVAQGKNFLSPSGFSHEDKVESHGHQFANPPVNQVTHLVAKSDVCAKNSCTVFLDLSFYKHAFLLKPESELGRLILEEIRRILGELPSYLYESNVRLMIVTWSEEANTFMVDMALMKWLGFLPKHLDIPAEMVERMRIDASVAIELGLPESFPEVDFPIELRFGDTLVSLALSKPLMKDVYHYLRDRGVVMRLCHLKNLRTELAAACQV